MLDHRPFCVFTIALIASFLWGPPASAQEINSVFAGYATTGYEARWADSLHHDLSASVTPVALVGMGEDVLFEGELDVSLHDGSTTTTLEHAQVYYQGWERVQVTAGKFHLPFGIWMHQTWINKMPAPPLTYGHAHGGVADEALLPLLFDVGLQAMGKIPIGGGWALGGAAWVSQGPARAEQGHHEAEGGHHENHQGEPGSAHESVEVPAISYGTNYADNNANKMVGGRLRVMNPRNLTVDVSGFYARYDAEGRLGVTGTNLSVKWQPGRFDVRGEGILLRQEFMHDRAVESVRRGGYYLQLTRRSGAYEPVLRWSHLPSSRIEETLVQSERRELAVGLIRWFTPSIPLKVAYQWRIDGADGVRLQWAFGF